MNYAGFWIRLLARAIDLLVLLPVGLFLEWMLWSLGNSGVILLIPYGLLSFLYFPYFHARSGQTLGKRAAGLKVIAENGAPIGWRESLLRSAVDGLWLAIWCAGMGAAIGNFSKQTSVVPWHHYMKALEPYTPLWYHKALFAVALWACVDVITLVVSKQKRSLHDLIGGTKVIVLPWGGRAGANS